MTLMGSLKREILELLDKDLEFRYAVAGYLGLSEILKRLDSITEEQKNLREEQTKIWREIASIREEQMSLREEQVKLREEQIRLREDFNKLRDDFNKLREDFNKMLAVIGRMDVRLSRVEKTLEKLTIDVEDEAKSVIKYRLKEMGINVDLTSLILPGLELNIYGVSDDICVIGEAAVRAEAGLVDKLLDKLGKLRGSYPEKLRKNIILVMYVSLPMVELVEKAKEVGIWLLKATEEFYRPGELFLKD
ncbi:hypothetical protein KEJ27_00915 [Candidatus Bathyarchaeota archaeon]|nr:hypothetical protein [Candidatus Bathyarchaeota archaeon]MBS7614083.1 hypothetical protein [Candidatus Bathyarchaeota archaeon]MBS7617393.1 hypothetical protein [Candidatus Bathyarchaeota archaeon]